MVGYGEFLASIPVLIVLHELAHAIAVLAVGLPLRGISFGGRDLTQGRRLVTIRGVEIRGALGLAGVTKSEYVDVPHLLARRRVVSLAGPLVNLAFAPLLLTNGWTFQVGFAAALFGVSSLLPTKFRGRRNDGMILVNSRADVAKWQQGARLRAAIAATNELSRGITDENVAGRLREVRQLAADPEVGAPAVPLLTTISAHCGSLTADLPIIRRHLASPIVKPSARARIGNEVAWELLCADGGRNRSDDESSREMADYGSNLAVEFEATCEYTHTRAEVLRRLGRLDEALPYARRAYELMPPDLAAAQRVAVEATLLDVSTQLSRRGNPGTVTPNV